MGSSLLTSKIEELVSDSRKASQTTEKNLRELLTASYSAITDVKASLGKTDEHVSSLKTSAQVHACSHPHCSLTLTVLSSSLSSSCPSTTHTHTITHSHTLLITCTCCYDQIKGTQDKDLSYSFSDSLFLFTALSSSLYSHLRGLLFS